MRAEYSRAKIVRLDPSLSNLPILFTPPPKVNFSSDILWGAHAKYMPPFTSRTWPVM
jgi:hypothetical protein